VELQLAADEGSAVLRVRTGASTATVDVGRDVVDLLTVLVAHNGALSGSRISTENDAILEHDASDGSTRLLGAGRFVPLGLQEGIPLYVVVAESGLIEELIHIICMFSLQMHTTIWIFLS